MFRNIYHSVKNILLYRSPRYPDNDVTDAFEDLKWEKHIDNAKRTITDIMLYGVGMRVVDSKDNMIPPRVYLTPVQRETKGLVEKHGFMVGLL